MRQARHIQLIALACASALLVSQADPAHAQRRKDRIRRPGTPARPAMEGDTVHIHYPEAVNLAAFVDYVSQSLNRKIIYGDEVKTQTVVFRPAEIEVPKDQLLDLLRSMLRMRDLALVKGDMDGWLRIVDTGDMQRFVPEIRPADGAADLGATNQVATQVVQLNSHDMQKVVRHARSFLSSPKASIIEVPERRMIIITDYESAIARAMEIIALVDVSGSKAELTTVPVKHQDAGAVAENVTALLVDMAAIADTEPAKARLHPSPTGTEILLVGTAEETAEVIQLIERFDVPAAGANRATTYTPRFASADRLRQLIHEVLLSGHTDDGVHLYVDEPTNRLYVTAPAALQQQIAELIDAEDQPAAQAIRPVRIYRPRNRIASDMIATLADVLPNIRGTNVDLSVPDSPATDKPKHPGPNRPPAPPEPIQELPPPPAQVPVEDTVETQSKVTRVEGDDFVLSLDEHTNSIIAIGSHEFHTQLAQLMEELDRRRPQVLIEMTLAALTFNDSMGVGVELATEDFFEDYRSLFFSSFGLSSIDLATGKRQLNPGGGLNGVIVGPDETPILLRAIAAHGKSRIITTPRIVVADNTTSSIGSVEESPFTSVNASSTVATTSFAGFESAGTTLTVTPHIGEGDHLRLEYTLNFSNFTGGGGGGVPPPRATNSFNGSLEIPDRHTIIVGGIVTDNEADSVTEVPLIGRVPVLGAFFQNSDRARTKFRVFAFITATVLRDDKFADLKLTTRHQLGEARIEKNDHPPGEVSWMR